MKKRRFHETTKSYKQRRRIERVNRIRSELRNWWGNKRWGLRLTYPFNITGITIRN